jgi:hypothetical protein
VEKFWFVIFSHGAFNLLAFSQVCGFLYQAPNVDKKTNKCKFMSELIPISALIGDRTYRIKIEPKDEEMVRKTLKTVNDKIIEFKTQFAGKDMQDYIAMVMIWFATEIEESQTKNLELDNVTGQLDVIERMLDGKQVSS